VRYIRRQGTISLCRGRLEFVPTRSGRRAALWPSVAARYRDSVGGPALRPLLPHPLRPYPLRPTLPRLPCPRSNPLPPHPPHCPLLRPRNPRTLPHSARPALHLTSAIAATPELAAQPATCTSPAYSSVCATHLRRPRQLGRADSPETPFTPSFEGSQILPLVAVARITGPLQTAPIDLHFFHR